MATWNWERLVTTYSIIDIPLVVTRHIDPEVLVDVSGVDRLGNLNPSNVTSFGHLDREWFERMRDEEHWDSSLAHEFREALRRRHWLWLAEVDAEDFSFAYEMLGHGLLHAAGPEQQGRIPIVVNPCAVVRAWLQGNEEERRFMRWATRGTDTLTMAHHNLVALRQAQVPVVERSKIFRLLRSPKVIAYILVLAYSALRALPVTFVPQFYGRLWALWMIDLTTAIPYTWGIIAMVAARKRLTRLVGTVVAVVTFVLPYVYFWTHGRSYPWFVTAIVIGMIAAAFGLELWRWLRDRMVARGLRAASEVPQKTAH